MAAEIRKLLNRRKAVAIITIEPEQTVRLAQAADSAAVTMMKTKALTNCNYPCKSGIFLIALTAERQSEICVRHSSASRFRSPAVAEAEAVKAEAIGG